MVVQAALQAKRSESSRTVPLHSADDTIKLGPCPVHCPGLHTRFYIPVPVLDLSQGLAHFESDAAHKRWRSTEYMHAKEVQG